MLTQKQIAAEIYRACIAYHRNQIRFYCQLSRETPTLRSHMLALARSNAMEIKKMMYDWKLS